MERISGNVLVIINNTPIGVRKEQMANEYLNAFEAFKSENDIDLLIEEGDAETKWTEFLGQQNLSNLVTFEEAVSGADLVHVKEIQCEESFINGQFKQFSEQLQELQLEDFLLYLEHYSPYELSILRHMARM